MKKGFFHSTRMEEFKQMFPYHSNKELAEYFNLSICTVKNYACMEGLFKSADHIKRVRTIAGSKKKSRHEANC